MITGVVLARNEQENIVDCMESFRPHVGEVILIDMESTDKTVELARPYVSKVISHPLVANFDPARNMAIGAAQYEWLWFLDADERIPPETGRLINEIVQQRGSEIVAITIPFKTYFCGQWMQHCGWWPGYTMPRVLKRGHFAFSEKLHAGVQFNGPELRIEPDPKLAIEHFSYRSIEHYVEKFNRYTSTEAINLAGQGSRPDWEQGMRTLMRDLWLYYERNDGNKDGYLGWILSWLAGQYRWFSQAKLADLPALRSEVESASVPDSLDQVLSVMGNELARLRMAGSQQRMGAVWHTPLFDPSGYAEDARMLLKAAALGERPVAAIENRWSNVACTLPEGDAALFRALARGTHPVPAIRITNCIPTLVRPDPHAEFNVLRTTFETDRIPEFWLPHIEQFDEVWVLSQHNATAFRRSGVAPERIRVLPEFIDTSLFSPEGQKLSLPESLRNRFVFLAVLDWQKRKGWDVLIRAYCEAFSEKDRVGLLLKITKLHGYTIEQIRQQIDAVLGQIYGAKREDGATLDAAPSPDLSPEVFAGESLGMGDTAQRIRGRGDRPGDRKGEPGDSTVSSQSQSVESRPDICIWDAVLEQAEMAALYRSVDAFVLASRGEGWGRPYMEAMATGLPTIGTRGSGNEDFMDDATSFLVDTTPTAVPAEAAEEITVYRGHVWQEPHLVGLRRAMRLVHQDRTQAQCAGTNAVAHIRKSHSLSAGKRALEAMMDAVERRLRPMPAQPVKPDQLRVELEGEFFAGHSFSNINEQLAAIWSADEHIALSLKRVYQHPTNDRGSTIEPQLRAYFGRSVGAPADVVIRHAFPANWQRPPNSRWVHIQPWEFGALPRKWVPPLRDLVDEIWSPSNYVKDVYVRSGIPAEKVIVIPWGIDRLVYRPDVPPLHLPIDSSFKFLYVGGSVHRKGIDILLRAYIEEFAGRRDVCLVIKDLGTTTFYRYGNYREQILRLLAIPAVPPIVYLDKDMTDGQRASLYTACDCLVAPYRGEGFGLPVLEAMACGLPPIVPKGGPTDDFVSEADGYFVPAQLVECDHDWRLCAPATELSIEVSDLRRVMRQAYEDRSATSAKGRAATEKARFQYTWQNSAERMLQRMRVLTGTSHAGQSGTLPVTAHERNGKPLDLTVCLATHNDERTIADCLARVQPFVREIVVADAASTDRTVAIAREYGARVYSVPTSDDHSSVRNLALRRSTSEWILSLEPDERLSDRVMEEITTLLARQMSEVAGVAMCCSDNETACDEIEVRLFRNDNQIVFEGCGMERVTDSIRRFGGQVLTTPFRIRRAASINGHAADTLRRIHRELAEHPRAPAGLFRLALAHFRTGNFFHAECYLNDFLQRVDAKDADYLDAARRIVDCYRVLNDPIRAQEWESKLVQPTEVRS